MRCIFGGNPTRRGDVLAYASYYSRAVIKSSLVSHVIPVTDSNERNNLHLTVGVKSVSSYVKVKYFHSSQRKPVLLFSASSHVEEGAI